MARNFSTPDVTGASVDGTGRRVGIVCARWNRTVTDRLLRGATDTLRTCGLRDDDIDVAWVPGAFELPLAAKVMAGMSLRELGELGALGMVVPEQWGGAGMDYMSLVLVMLAAFWVQYQRTSAPQHLPPNPATGVAEGAL